MVGELRSGGVVGLPAYTRLNEVVHSGGGGGGGGSGGTL